MDAGYPDGAGGPGSPSYRTDGNGQDRGVCATDIAKVIRVEKTARVPAAPRVDSCANP